VEIYDALSEKFNDILFHDVAVIVADYQIRLKGFDKRNVNGIRIKGYVATLPGQLVI